MRVVASAWIIPARIIFLSRVKSASLVVIPEHTIEYSAEDVSCGVAVWRQAVSRAVTARHIILLPGIVTLLSGHIRLLSGCISSVRLIILWKLFRCRWDILRVLIVLIVLQLNRQIQPNSRLVVILLRRLCQVLSVEIRLILR